MRLSIVLCPGIIPFDGQVAGHIYEPGTKIIGILQDKKDDSVIYKSFGKPACGLRETKFYMSLENDCQQKNLLLQRQYFLNGADDSENTENSDPEKCEILNELKSFIPKFYGHVKFNFNGSEVSGFSSYTFFFTFKNIFL